MKNPVIMHATYAEQGQSIPEMCALAARCGFDGIEFRRRTSSFTGSPEQYLDAIAAATAQYKIGTICFGAPGPNLMLADPAQRQAEIESMLSFLRLAAARFPPTVCLTTSGSLINKNAPGHVLEQQGSGCATPEQWEWSADGFKIIGDCAAELGWRMAFETHMHYLHDRVEPTRKLTERIGRPSIGIALDYANLQYFKEPPGIQEALTGCGERLFYLHLKNFIRVAGPSHQGEIRCGLRDGIINNRELLRRLKATGFSGPIAIEAPRQGDREAFAEEDLAYLRALMRQLA